MVTRTNNNIEQTNVFINNKRQCKLEESPTRHQTCLLITVFNVTWGKQQTDTSIHFDQRVSVVLIFSMRSYEYSMVQGDYKTKKITY